MIVPGRSLVSAGTGLQCMAASLAVCETSLKSWVVCEGGLVSCGGLERNEGPDGSNGCVLTFLFAPL